MWDPWTLLLDERQTLGGLWLAGSLFNHSCLGNVVTSFCYGEDGRLSTLVARAATNIAAGEELCHTYIYPLETVDERRAKLRRSYGFECCCPRCELEAPLADVATGLADRLEPQVQRFSALRSAGDRSSATEMGKVIKEIQKVLAEIRQVAQRELERRGGTDALLWRSQFLWGSHCLAMALEHLGLAPGRMEEAAEAYRSCVELAALLAPSSGYELKYRVMLVQCLTRAVQAFGPQATFVTSQMLKEALKEAEEAHHRCFGGGGRHFVARMQPRLQEVFAALKLLAS